MNLYVLLIIRIAGTFEEIDGLVQDCSNSIAYALELLQSCTKPANAFDILLVHWDMAPLPSNWTGLIHEIRANRKLFFYLQFWAKNYIISG